MNKPFLDTLRSWPWTLESLQFLGSKDNEILDAESSIVAAIDDPIVANLVLAPELVEALQYCECELTLYQGLAEQSENPQAWYDAIAKARTVLNKLKGNIEDEQPTLF